MSGNDGNREFRRYSDKIIDDVKERVEKIDDKFDEVRDDVSTLKTDHALAAARSQSADDRFREQLVSHAQQDTDRFAALTQEIATQRKLIYTILGLAAGSNYDLAVNIAHKISEALK